MCGSSEAEAVVIMSSEGVCACVCLGIGGHGRPMGRLPYPIITGHQGSKSLVKYEGWLNT